MIYIMIVLINKNGISRSFIALLLKRIQAVLALIKVLESNFFVFEWL